jgi:hypothetical protein
MKMEKKMKYNIGKILSAIVMISFIAPLGFLIYKIATTSNVITEASIDERVKSDYILMLLECVLGIFAMMLPSILTKKFSVDIPDKIYYLYVLFLYAAIYLGEVRDFYYVIPYWDIILHAMSGLMMGFLGFSLVDILNNSNKSVTLTPFFVAFFAFAFAITVGVVWEVYEFSADGIFGTNMQKYKLQNGTELIGREAVKDTMEDLIVDGVSAFVACIIGYISLKYKKGWMNDLRIKIKHKKTKEEEIKNE